MEQIYNSNGITLYCGDSRGFDPGPVDIVITDPPYGVDHDTDYTRFTGGVAAERSSHARIAGDQDPFDPAPLLKVGKQQILFGANCFSDRLPLGSWLIWDKRNPGGSKNVMSDGEAAWWSKGHGLYVYTHTWDGFNRASERQTAYHPSQKPVALFRWCLQRARLAPGAVVYDPYMGSGPVAQACKELGYRYIGVELVEAYCEVAAQRLSQEVMDFTDLQAHRRISESASARRARESGAYEGQTWMEGCLDALVRRGEG